MTRTVKIGGSLVVGVFVLALLTLRLVGLEPQYLDPAATNSPTTTGSPDPDCGSTEKWPGRW